MQVNQTNVNLVFANLNAAFNGAFKEAQITYTKIAEVVPSTTAVESFDWLDDIQGMEEWVGKKTIQDLKQNGYFVRNKDFQRTIRIKRNDIEDDRVGIYGTQAKNLAIVAKRLPEKNIYALVNNAFIDKCFDGKPFISDTHKIGKLTISNKGTKALDASSLAAAEASFGAAVVAMSQITNEYGEPLNITPNVLLVPPALEAKAKVLMTADHFKDNEPNPYKGKCEVVVCNLLTDPKAWFLFDTTQFIQPLIWLDRKKPVLVQQTNMDSESVFMEGNFLFGVEARGSAAYTFWQLAYGSTGTQA